MLGFRARLVLMEVRSSSILIQSIRVIRVAIIPTTTDLFFTVTRLITCSTIWRGAPWQRKQARVMSRLVGGGYWQVLPELCP